ncbi:sugar phosphate isomerase/epimerase [Novosphingobium sp. G106]|uniref:sugar phosphate isomerase/epimerase family protein n=1 Tax=Novosphingobium sp. G106 TaxID=2849500 RepID=UPI001C2D1BC8|nr:sugar phosphate isomerase/epimerase [Novosphingobium sp. G106]MBV1690581.1 sugar phosphate isomerase/epimerase [Novosphingobium sp. G106]
MTEQTIGLAWGTVYQANLIETIEVAARHGFPTLQIPPDIYHECLAAGTDAKALRRRLADAGVSVRVVDGITGGLPGMPTEPVMFKGKAMLRFDIAACLEVAEALDAPIINVSHFGATTAQIEATAEAVASACRLAATRGVTVVLEFVPDSGNPSIGNAQAIVAACGERNCKIHLDTWHLTRSGGTVADIRALPPGSIGAFQLSDRIAPPPGTAYVPMTGRSLPGEGELPLGEIVAAALANSPDITIEVEVFSEELAAMTADGAAARTAQAVRAWRKQSL